MMNNNPVTTRKITFEIRSLRNFQLDMTVFPELSSHKRWIQKGIDILKKHSPRVLRYLSQEKTIAELYACAIIIETTDDIPLQQLRAVFYSWIKRQKTKRLILVIAESLVLPITPFLALLPGPNIFFYIPALLVYYHFRSYQGLSRAGKSNLEICYAPLS